MTQKKCVSCKRIREHKAKGLCESCYGTRRTQHSFYVFGERLQVSNIDRAEARKIIQETKKAFPTKKDISRMLDEIKIEEPK